MRLTHPPSPPPTDTHPHPVTAPVSSHHCLFGGVAKHFSHLVLRWQRFLRFQRKKAIAQQCCILDTTPYCRQLQGKVPEAFLPLVHLWLHEEKVVEAGADILQVRREYFRIVRILGRQTCPPPSPIKDQK